MEVVAGHSIVNYHFSLQKLATRLAVTFLPRPLVASSHQIISPGFLLSVSTSISGLALEIINAYLHPRRLPQLLTHLQTPHNRGPRNFSPTGPPFNPLATVFPNNPWDGTSKFETILPSFWNEIWNFQNCALLQYTMFALSFSTGTRFGPKRTHGLKCDSQKL